MPLESLTFRSPARTASGLSNKPSAVLSARYEKRIASIAGIPFTTQSLSRSTGRLNRRLKDAIARQSRPAPVALQRYKKAILMRNIFELNVLLRTRVELKIRPKRERAESGETGSFSPEMQARSKRRFEWAGGISSRFHGI